MFLLRTRPWNERLRKFRFPSSVTLQGATFVFPAAAAGSCCDDLAVSYSIRLGNRRKVVGAADGTTRGHVAPSSVVLQGFLRGAGRNQPVLLRCWSGGAPEGKRASEALRVGPTGLRQVLLPARVRR